jgi:hypothetical protein
MIFTFEQLESIANKYGLKFVDVGDLTYRFLYHDVTFSIHNWAIYFPEGQYKSFINFRAYSKNKFIPKTFNYMRYNVMEETEFPFNPHSIEDLEQQIITIIEDFKQFKINNKLSIIEKDFI